MHWAGEKNREKSISSCFWWFCPFHIILPIYLIVHLKCHSHLSVPCPKIFFTPVFIKSKLMWLPWEGSAVWLFHSSAESSIQPGQSVFTETDLIPTSAPSRSLCLAPLDNLSGYLKPTYLSGSYCVPLRVRSGPQWSEPPLDPYNIDSLNHPFAFCLTRVTFSQISYLFHYIVNSLKRKITAYISSYSLYHFIQCLAQSRYSINVFDVIYILIWH